MRRTLPKLLTPSCNTNERLSLTETHQSLHSALSPALMAKRLSIFLWVMQHANHLAAILVACGASLGISMETIGNEEHKRPVAIGCCLSGAWR